MAEHKKKQRAEKTPQNGGGLADRMGKCDRSKEDLEREAEWKQVNGELGELRAAKGNVRGGRKGSTTGGWLACERAANVCLKERTSRGSHLTDESANIICHRDLEHKRRAFCKLKLFAEAVKTDAMMKMN